MKVEIQLDATIAEFLANEKVTPVAFGLVRDEYYVSMESPPRIRNRNEPDNSLGKKAVRLIVTRDAH